MSEIGKFIGSVLGSSGFSNAIGALGTIGSILGGSSQRSAQERINEQNIAMQRETNALQQSMFNKNLAWQRESQQIQNDYNSIQNQVQQALDAGVNPNAILGGSSSGVGAAGSGMPGLTAPHSQMIDSSSRNTIQNITDVARAIADISNSGLSEARKNEINQTLEARIKGMNLDNDQKELANALLTIDVRFKNSRSQVEYDNLVKDLAVKSSQIRLNESLDEKAQMEAIQAIENSFLTKTRNLIAKKDLSNYDEKFKNEMDVLRSQVKLNNTGAQKNVAQAHEAYSSAHLFDEKAMTEQTVRDLNKFLAKMNDSLSALNSTRNKFEQQTLRTRVMQEMSKLTGLKYANEQAKQDVEYARARAEQAAYDNDMKAFTYWSNFAFSIVDRGVNAINAVKGLPSTPWSVDAKQHDVQETYVESNEPFYNTQTGETGIHKKHTSTKTYKR